MIEARNSRVAGNRYYQYQQAGSPFPVKGDFAEEAYAGPAGKLLGRCRICIVLSQMWSAICVVGTLCFLQKHTPQTRLFGDRIVCGVFI